MASANKYEVKYIGKESDEGISSFVTLALNEYQASKKCRAALDPWEIVEVKLKRDNNRVRHDNRGNR